MAKDMRGMGGRIWGMRRIKIEKGPRLYGEGGETACMSRERSVAEEEGGMRACMLREECCGRRGRREGVYVAGGVLRMEREERGRVCRKRSVTGEYVKEVVRGGETSSVFFFSPSSSAFFFAAASSSFFFLRAAPSSFAFFLAASS